MKYLIELRTENEGLVFYEVKYYELTENFLFMKWDSLSPDLYIEESVFVPTRFIEHLEIKSLKGTEGTS